jgi:hypothetical protein
VSFTSIPWRASWSAEHDRFDGHYGFDTSVFSAVPLGTVGNTGLSIMHGPPQRRMDLSIFKNLTVGQTRRLQLRAEVYNVTNTPSFWLPDFNYGSPGFGSISSTGNSIPRQMQFGIKYLF